MDKMVNPELKERSEISDEAWLGADAQPALSASEVEELINKPMFTVEDAVEELKLFGIVLGAAIGFLIWVVIIFALGGLL